MRSVNHINKVLNLVGVNLPCTYEITTKEANDKIDYFGFRS